MNTIPLATPSVRTLRRAFFGLLSFLVSAAFALAQLESGTITGKVTDNATGAPLSGAIIRIESLLLEESSDREGDFTINFVPAGTHTVNVSYLGLEAKNFQVTVLANQRAMVAAKMGDETIMLEAMNISGQKAGQARTLNDQRASGNLRTIVSADAAGRFPDQNAAESMQRITGVSLERDQGEGRFISVRGVDPDLNNTQLNGVSIPASQEDSRKVNLDVFPADILDSIEVVKAITPDMDGDAIGGSVNIKTQTAFSSDSAILRASAEGSYNDVVEKWGYKYGAVWGDKFKNDTIGFLVSFSTAKREFGSDGRETDDTPWSRDPVTGFIEPGGDIQHREYNIKRWRQGASFSLDFRPSIDNNFYIRGVYSHFSDYENRFRTRFRSTAATVTPTSNTTGTGAGRIVVDLKDRYEDNNVYSISAGAEHQRGPWEIDYLAAYSKAELVDPFRIQPAFRTANTTWNYSFADPQNPVFTGTGVNLSPSAFTFNSWALDKGMNEEDEITVAANIKREIRFGQRQGHLKFGAKYRAKKRTVDITSDALTRSGTLPLTAFVRTSSRGVTPTFPSIDPTLFRRYYATNAAEFVANPVDSQINGAAEDYTTEENILAGYAMADVTFNKLTVITGIRAEQTDYENKAFNVNKDATVITPTTIVPVTASKDYLNVLPGVITRYDFSQRFIGRASWTNTLARPKPLDGSASQSTDDGNEFLGNPKLKPYTSNNFDASLEFYPKSLGVFSVGAFHKDIKDFIYSQTTAGVVTGGGSRTIALNGDSATVTGVEIDAQQQLNFLPSPLNGFGIYANATLTDSESILADGRKVPFMNQSKKIYNLALSYEKYKFFIRASLNYRSKYLSFLGATSPVPNLGAGAGDQYVEDHTQIDISANYKFLSRYTIYAEVLNVTDEPYSAIYNVSNGLRKAEFYSWSANVGVKYSF